MKKLGVGVIGFGFMGKMHTFGHRTIPFYYSPEPVPCALKVVCEVNEDLARAAQVQGGFERFTTDPNALIQADDVDIVHICTPNQQHFAALQAAIKANKHIYVDKPVTGSLEEAEALEKLLPDYKGVAQVALQCRYFPPVLRAKELIEEGFLGPVTHFRAVYLHGGSIDPDKPVNWKSTAAAGGGVIRDLGSHILDVLAWLIGPFQSANCIGRIWAKARPNKDKPGEMMAIDVEEAAAIMLRDKDGAFGTVDVSKLATGTDDELRFEIHGRYGAVRFNGMQPNYLEAYDARARGGDLGGNQGWQAIASASRFPAPGGKFPGPIFSIGFDRVHVHCLANFLQAVAGRAEPSPSLAEGIHLQRMLEAVRDSAESLQWVSLPQPQS